MVIIETLKTGIVVTTIVGATDEKLLVAGLRQQAVGQNATVEQHAITRKSELAAIVATNVTDPDAP